MVRRTVAGARPEYPGDEQFHEQDAKVSCNYDYEKRLVLFSLYLLFDDRRVGGRRFAVDMEMYSGSVKLSPFFSFICFAVILPT